MTHRFKAVPTFWKSFHKLSPRQQAACRRLWPAFKQNPFAPQFKTHKIHALSAKAGETVFAAVIEADLRVVFVQRGDLVVSLDVGSHAIYRT